MIELLWSSFLYDCRLSSNVWAIMYFELYSKDHTYHTPSLMFVNYWQYFVHAIGSLLLLILCQVRLKFPATFKSEKHVIQQLNQVHTELVKLAYSVHVVLPQTIKSSNFKAFTSIMIYPQHFVPSKTCRECLANTCACQYFHARKALPAKYPRGVSLSQWKVFI